MKILYKKFVVKVIAADLCVIFNQFSWSRQCPENGIYEVSERLAQKKEWLCYAIFERFTWNKPQYLL